MLYPDDFVNKIICGDCISVMAEIPSNSIDLVVTSPPYNLNIRKIYKTSENWKGKWNKSKLQLSGYDSHNDNMPEDKYCEWQHKILLECLRVIKDDGAIFYNHKWRVQKGLLQQRPSIVEGLPVRQIIIWKRAGGINFHDTYFLPTYEIIYLIAKPKFKLVPKANAMTDVWSITQTKHDWHPAAFPIELANRCISSTNAKTVLDPFIGSGTVAKASKLLNRNYIGIDISEVYCNKIREELNQNS